MAYYGNKVSNTWRVAVFLVIYTSQVSVTLGQITVGLPVIPRTTYYQESGSPPTAWVLRTNQLPAEHFVHRVSFYIQTDFSGTFSGNILIWERMVNIPGLSYRLLYKQHVQYRNTSGEQVVDIYYGRRVDSNSFIGWSFSQSQGPISMEYASTPLNGTHVIYTNDIDLVETKIYNSSFNKPVFFSFQAVVSTSFTGVGAKGVKGEEGMQGFKGEKGVAGSPGPQGQQGVSGDPGPRGQKGDKGLPGLKGNQGSKGQKGELGEAGSVGGTGSKGIKGIKGEAGPKGQQGPTGPQGETGIKGVKGDKGISGDQGLKGIKGVSGGKGEQGTSGDKGFIGPQGPKGIQGAKGDVGPKGAAGPGDKGAVGSKGPVGGRGITGDKGVRGNAGDQGLKGEKGDIGPPGSTGVSGESQGPPGPQGPQGVLGDKGPKGEKGSKGDSDLTGLPGEKGDTGSQGYKGTRGIKGDIGSKGVIGGSGPKGDKGGFGPTGIKGDKGDIGEKGDNGVPGIIGPTGPPGNTGPTGDPGVTGQPGSQGITGEVGDQGYKGQPGDEGPPGPTGAPGVQGDVGPKGDRGPKGEMANVINYCALQNGRCQHVCVDLYNSSMCTCYSGYSLQPDRRSCEDIDECISSPCEYDCVNTPGSFICTCPDGYTVDSHVTTRCQNWELVFKATTGAPFGVTALYMGGGTLNENNMTAKQMNNDVTEHYKSDIVNTWEDQNVQRVKIGLYNNGSEIAHVIFDGRDSTKTSWFNKSRVLQSSYNISHLTSQAFGYSIDGSLGRPSQSFNIFLFGGLCGMGVVSVADSALPGSPCDIDTQNLTTVYASTGTGSVSANGNLYAIVDCMGIFVERDNACIMNNGGCQHKCHNMGQQKMCSCNDGYELNIDDVTCSDVDECSRFMPCAHNCTNQLGGYLCSCREGFFSDNNDCFDINECDSPSVCGNRVCINTFGSYVCLQAVLVTHSQRGVTAGIIQAPDIVHGNPDVILDAENLSISKAVLEMKLGILGIGFTFFIVIFCITKFLIKSRNRLKLEEENLADLSKGLHHVHVFKDDSTSNKQTYVSGYAAGGENSGYATDDINKLSLSLRGLSLDDVL